uniref:G_PROTEIN_RECEP_F1_2 domain-containing protein n=1 Tax=Ascaris lumbricoides TaxID=6252 RepID=A0A0M3INT3_ASCLU
MLSSMNVYLCALAISDMTIIITAFFLFFLENMRARSVLISKFFAMLAPVTFPLGLTAQSLSVFLTVTAAVDCFILVASSMNVYLCALAISDMTIIITAFFLFFLENMRARSVLISKFFAMLAPVTFPLGLTAQSLSVFLTVTAAVDCFILVASSQSCKQRFCSVNVSLQALVGIVFMAALYNSPHMFEIFVIDCWSVPYSQQSLDVCPTDLRQNQMYFTIYYAWMYTLVMAVGPVILLIVLNSAIVICMRRSPPQVDSDSDIITLVLVVCLFISCNILLLFGIVNSYLIDLSNLMVVVNSSCNFLIYYAFGSRFRRTLKQYISALLHSSPVHITTKVTNGTPHITRMTPHTELLI